nr:hypothetical protein [Tanacetum cinerariifolium]
VDVAVTLESVLEVKERLKNSVYRFFLGKGIANPVADNYVKNAWSRFVLFVLIWKWSPLTNVSKEDFKRVPVWVKDYGVPITAFTKDELCTIATKLGNSKDVKFNNEDNDSKNDVEEDNNKITSFMTSKSSKGIGSLKSESETEKMSLYDHLKDDYDDNPYDDEEHEDFNGRTTTFL